MLPVIIGGLLGGLIGGLIGGGIAALLDDSYEADRWIEEGRNAYDDAEWVVLVKEKLRSGNYRKINVGLLDKQENVLAAESWAEPSLSLGLRSELGDRESIVLEI